MGRCAFILLILLAPLFTDAQIRSHRVSKSFDLPFENAYDLTWDGEDLWISHGEGKLSRVDDRRGSVLQQTTHTELGIIKGLTYDGLSLWVAATEKEEIHRIDPSRGISTETYPTPAQGLSRPSGLTWDGEQFWNNDTRSFYCGSPDQDLTMRFSPGESVEKSFDGVGDCPFGLAFGNGYLWVGENSHHRIYMLDTADGRILDSLEAPSPYVNGLTYAKGGLWIVINAEEGPELHRIEVELREKDQEEAQEMMELDGKSNFFYPNPADDHLRIELPHEAPKGKKRLELYGSNGKRILIRSIEGRTDRIRLPELSNGIHHLRILNDGELWRSSTLLIAQ